jgi:hypothetical protein
MLHRAIKARPIRSHARHRASAGRAEALLPLLLQFSMIVAAAAFMGAGYAMAWAWCWLVEHW